MAASTTAGPMLAAVEPHKLGCRLVLEPCAEVLLDLSVDRLRAWFEEQGLDLDALCAQQRAPVYYRPVRMTVREWAGISELLLAHRVATRVLRSHPAVIGALRRSHSEICAAPYRMFAGVSTRAAPSIYLAHPFDFYPKNGGHYCLLSDREWLLKTWVQVKRREVQMGEDLAPGHFVSG